MTQTLSYVLFLLPCVHFISVLAFKITLSQAKDTSHHIGWPGKWLCRIWHERNALPWENRLLFGYLSIKSGKYRSLTASNHVSDWFNRCKCCLMYLGAMYNTFWLSHDFLFWYIMGTHGAMERWLSSQLIVSHCNAILTNLSYVLSFFHSSHADSHTIVLYSCAQQPFGYSQKERSHSNSNGWGDPTTQQSLQHITMQQVLQLRVGSIDNSF